MNGPVKSRSAIHPTTGTAVNAIKTTASTTQPAMAVPHFPLSDARASDISAAFDVDMGNSFQ